jgi:hypothetical protein
MLTGRTTYCRRAPWSTHPHLARAGVNIEELAGDLRQVSCIFDDRPSGAGQVWVRCDPRGGGCGEAEQSCYLQLTA